MSAAKKDRRGSGQIPVPSLTENMGLGGRIKTGTPKPILLVREAAGHGAGKSGGEGKSSAKPIKTIHKGAQWDGPKPRVALPKGSGKK